MRRWPELSPWSLRWKLLAFFVGAAVIPLTVMNRYAVGYFDRYTRRALEDQMVSHAVVAAEQYRRLVLHAPATAVEAGEAAFADLVRAYLPWVHVRIRLLDAGGVVRFDSSQQEQTVGSELGALPEVARALGGRYGARSQLSADRQIMMYYVALPVREGDRVAAVAYVSRNTSPIIRAIQRMAADQRMAMGVSLAGAVLVAVALSATLTRRLRRLTRATAAFAEGREPLRLRVEGRDEIGELARGIGSMATEIGQRNAYNRDFVSTLTHELRAPLTAIKGAAEVLEQGAAEEPAARERFLRNIRHGVDRMIRMTGELLDLTRLDAEDLRAARRELEYGALVREIVARLEPCFPQPRAAFTLEVPEAPIPVSVVPGHIEQLLANLLDNAFRHTPSTGLVACVIEREGSDTVCTTVRDTGSGIAPAILPRVFDRFFTTRPRDGRCEGGSGLGLAIAQSIVRNHGGSLWVESVEGQGARFRFRLPCGR